MIPQAAMRTSAPRARRSLASLASVLATGGKESEKLERRPAFPIALLLGAGVDNSLRKRPLWSGFVRQIADETLKHSTESPKRTQRPEAGHDQWSDEAALTLESLAKDWSIEAAQALHVAVGSFGYWRALRRVVTETGEPQATEMTDGLLALVNLGVNVIVNFNYTGDVLNVLRRSKKSIRVINRHHLAAWNLDELLFPPQGIVHLIHVHGLVDPGSSGHNLAVLDRHSYDELVLGSQHYLRLLGRLVQDFTVISIGFSWADVPIRSVAAQTRFEFPVASRTHYALFRTNGNLMDQWLEQAFVTSYSVRPLFCTEYEDFGKKLHELAEVSETAPVENIPAQPASETLSEIADYLDLLGDYESRGQSDWMAQGGITSETGDSNAQRLIRAICTFHRGAISLETWLALARIERHLRHFVFFYYPRQARHEIRSTVWEKIAELWLKLPETAKRSIWNEDDIVGFYSTGTSDDRWTHIRGVFEFSLGAYETADPGRVSGQSEAREEWINNLELLREHASTETVSNRIGIASALWPIASRDYNKLRQLSLACRWESIHSKVALDEAQDAFKACSCDHKGLVPREWGDLERTRILVLSNDARDAGRASGCLRRELGAIVTASFVKATREAEADLIAVLQRFLRNKGHHAEVSMIWWIYVGLLAVLLDSGSASDADGNDSKQRAREAAQWLDRTYGPLDFPSGDELEGILGNPLEHWGEMHSQAADIARTILEEGSSILSGYND